MTEFEPEQDSGERFAPEISREIDRLMDAAGKPWYEAVAIATGNWPEIPTTGDAAQPATELEPDDYDWYGHPKDTEASFRDRLANHSWHPMSPQSAARQQERNWRGHGLVEGILLAALERRADRNGVPVGAQARAEWDRRHRRIGR